MKQFNNESMKQFNKGFGLLEVVISTGILVIVISASVIISKMAVRSSVVSLERVQAYNLAQQGMEGVRAIRDTNWLNGRAWNDSLDPSMSSYDVNNSNNLWQLTNTIEPIPLDNKDFTRVITISSIDQTMANILSQYNSAITSDKMLKIKVSVSWREYDQDWSTILYTYLSDWKPGL
jgi:type II secretory pathway pseudopilin PulG